MNPYLIEPASIIEKRQEAEDIFTLRLRVSDSERRRQFRFAAGQFNMLYLYGVGEIPVSIMSDPDDAEWLDHTIRVVGRVTQAMARLEPGDALGIRGPFGRGWPLDRARGHDVLFVTGGLGCAPVAGAIDYLFRRREAYGAVKILHGVKKPKDLLYRERFDAWRRHTNTEVYLASDEAGKSWRYHVGVVTELFETVRLAPERTIVMMCGPEIMMRMASQTLVRRGIPADAIYVSLERRMECAIGLCGHCQLQPYFVCKDGPVMSYAAVQPFLGRPGV